MMLHMFHMTNYTIQKEEEGVRGKGRRKNNDEEDEREKKT